MKVSFRDSLWRVGEKFPGYLTEAHDWTQAMFNTSIDDNGTYVGGGRSYAILQSRELPEKTLRVCVCFLVPLRWVQISLLFEQSAQQCKHCSIVCHATVNTGQFAGVVQTHTHTHTLSQHSPVSRGLRRMHWEPVCVPCLREHCTCVPADRLLGDLGAGSRDCCYECGGAVFFSSALVRARVCV